MIIPLTKNEAHRLTKTRRPNNSPDFFRGKMVTNKYILQLQRQQERRIIQFPSHFQIQIQFLLPVPSRVSAYIYTSAYLHPTERPPVETKSTLRQERRRPQYKKHSLLCPMLKGRIRRSGTDEFVENCEVLQGDDDIYIGSPFVDRWAKNHSLPFVDRWAKNHSLPPKTTRLVKYIGGRKTTRCHYGSAVLLCPRYRAPEARNWEIYISSASTLV